MSARTPEILHAAFRGVIAAAAMTGVRALTVNLGLVEEPPPKAIVDKSGLLRFVPKTRRRAVIELLHWAYGAKGGAIFGLLPEGVRRRAWAGPVYGLVRGGRSSRVRLRRVRRRRRAVRPRGAGPRQTAQALAGTRPAARLRLTA